MNTPAPQFPILGAKDTIIVPVAGFAWAMMIQGNSYADAAITNFMGERMKLNPAPAAPAPPAPDFEAYPQFSAAGVGSLCIAEMTWLALVRMGIPGQQGPNPTEAALMEFHRKFGTRKPR